MHAKNTDPRPAVVVALTFLVATTAFAVDVSLAAFPDVAAAFDVPLSAVQRSVGVFLIGYGLGQIPVGLAADTFGRRPVLLVGMSAFVILGFLAAIAPSIEMLLAMRFGQGFAAATGVTLSRTLGRDMTDGAATSRLMAHLASAFGIAMIVAPAVGALFLMGFGWRGPFAASALWGGIGLVLCAIYLPETRPAETKPQRFRTAVVMFFTTPVAVLGTALTGLAFCGIITFVTFASEIFIEAEGLSPLGFAGCFAVVALGTTVGARAVRWAAQTRSDRAILLALAALFVLAAGALGVLRGGPLWASILALSGMLGLVGGTMGLSVAVALKPLGKIAGLAAGLLGSIQVLMGAAFSSALTVVGLHSMDRLLGVMAILSLCLASMTYAVVRSLDAAGD